MDFYSARLIYVILVQDGKPRKKNDYDESTIVFRARNFRHAFRRALTLGRKRETVYENCYGQKVKWALVEVSTLDHIGRKVDSAEVSSRLHSRVGKKPIPFRKKFHPEKSDPGETF